MPSPICTVNGSPTPVAVTAGATAQLIALVSGAGVNFWSIYAISTDELNTIASVNATVVPNFPAKTATFTAPPGLGSAVIFQSIVGVRALGLDANGILQPSYYTTFKVDVQTAQGLNVIALNEISEESPSFGWIIELNQAIRALSASGGAYTIPTAPQYISSATSIAFAGAIQPVSVKTSGSSYNIVVPSATDGQIFELDNTDGSFASHAVGLTVGTGVSIENPVGSAYTTAGTMALPLNPGGIPRSAYRWKYYASSSSPSKFWKLS
jgi:hypothetical protein